MGDFRELEDLIGRVGRVENNLRDSTAHHFELVQDYEAVAKRLAGQVLRGMKPNGKSDADWQVRVASLLKAVSADIIQNGIFLTMVPPESRKPGSRGIADADLMDWIDAGLRGEGGDAKVITSEDRDLISEHGTQRGKRIIAMKVSRAFYSSRPKANYERMRRAISGYLDGNMEEGGEAEGMLEAVLAVWNSYFQGRYESDMARLLNF